eukprot:Pgem_evm1s7609
MMHLTSKSLGWIVACLIYATLFVILIPITYYSVVRTSPPIIIYDHMKPIVYSQLSQSTKFNINSSTTNLNGLEEESFNLISALFERVATYSVDAVKQKDSFQEYPINLVNGLVAEMGTAQLSFRFNFDVADLDTAYKIANDEIYVNIIATYENAIISNPQ